MRPRTRSQLPNGNVACYAATQAATAARYANCVPINPFGPTAISQSAFNYVFETTAFRQTNTLDDFGGGISGEIFEGWGAGPITAALSGEMRFNAYDVQSNVPSSTFVDCTGLRICNPQLPSYAQSIIQLIHASQNVREVALETNVPVLKDLPLIQAFDLNLAGRYTSYSVSGEVQTWEDRLQLECRRQPALPRHDLDRHSRAHTGRPVPSGDAGAERLQRRPPPSTRDCQLHNDL